MNAPVVSVVIPTFKRTEYLKLTLNSISNQTYKKFEVIVVDDGTPENGNEVLCKSYSFCKYLKIKNSGGPARPRNRGIEIAQGKYIAFVDDDDIWLPNKLEKQVNILEENSDFGLVHCFCDVIDEEGNKTGEQVGRPGSPDVKHGFVFKRMIGAWTVMSATPLIRKESIEKSGGFNENMPAAGEDAEFFVRLALETKFYFINEALVLYRKYSKSISFQNENYLLTPLYLSHVAELALAKGNINREEFSAIIHRLINKVFKKKKKRNLSNDALAKNVHNILTNKLDVKSQIKSKVINFKNSIN